MWQRPQTVFLLAIAVSMAFFNFFPIWTQDTGALQLELNSFQLVSIKEGTRSVQSSVYIAITSLLSAGLSIFALLSFTSRKKQIRICQINSFILIVLTFLVTYPLFSTDASPVSSLKETHTGLYFLLSALISNIIATRLIRKDEQQVREADRL